MSDPLLASILRRGFDEYRQFVNPVNAERAALGQEPVRLVRAEDGRLFDTASRALEDFHGTQALGHRSAAVDAALRAFLDSDAPSWFPTRVNPFAGRLARRLCERTGYETAFFGCSGSDAVEAALKLARAATGRPRLLSLRGAYHGCSLGSCSLMSPGPLRDPFGPHLPGAEVLPFADADALRRALAPGDVAAVVVEPIQGEGGVRELPADYVEALCALTEEHRTLLVADEAQTGLGRTGLGFLASETWPRRPDVALLAKALGGGLMPISALLTRRELFLQAYGANFVSGESHSITFGQNALAFVAALATLDEISDELLERVERVGGLFLGKLREALDGSPLVAEVRGRGLMLGIALEPPDHPWLSFEGFGLGDLADRTAIAPLLAQRLYRHGFYCFPSGHDWRVLRLQPRYDIPVTHLDAFALACREEIDRLCDLT